MKEILLLSVIVGLAFTIEAQCTLPYKSLSSFANDTTAFINYNFSKRADYYVGKTIKEVISDMKIPIQSHLIHQEIKDKKFTNKYSGIYIFIYPYSTMEQFMHRHIAKNMVLITLETSINIDEFNSYEGTEHNKWTSQIENYLNGQIIKSIDIVK